MNRTFLKATAACGFVLFALNTYADPGMRGKAVDTGHMRTGQMPGEAGKVASASEGVVEDIDKANNIITLRHGPIKSATIEMEPMTMPFMVKDASLLSKVKVGDKVQFTAEYIANEVTITSLAVRK